MKTKKCEILTLRVHKMLGTGLPEALHSNVIVPPFLAVSWPLAGDARILGGTETKNTLLT